MLLPLLLVCIKASHLLFLLAKETHRQDNAKHTYYQSHDENRTIAYGLRNTTSNSGSKGKWYQQNALEYDVCGTLVVGNCIDNMVVITNVCRGIKCQ